MLNFVDRRKLCEDKAFQLAPQNWRVVHTGQDGTAYEKIHDKLRVIISWSIENDSHPWLHVSLSRPSKMPSYDDMVEVKDAFIGEEHLAIQLFTPRSEHVNIHPYCLHLWTMFDNRFLPDFTKGSKSI